MYRLYHEDFRKDFMDLKDFIVLIFFENQWKIQFSKFSFDTTCIVYELFHKYILVSHTALMLLIP